MTLPLFSHLRVGLCAAWLASPWACGAQPFPPVTVQKVAVPSYFYPGPVWERMGQGVPALGLAIINPDSGPGALLDKNYVQATQRAQARGVRVLGYVATGYGTRPKADVKAEITQYYNRYHVDGIFLDEAANACAQVPYYQALFQYIKTKGGAATVAINPGMVTPECYAPAADIIVNFEGSAASYATWQPAGWELNYPPERFWHLVYSTPKSQLAQVLALSRGRQAGWVYVTPDALPNPWDTLPGAAYWQAELDGVSR